MRFVILDTNIWIDLLEGKLELTDLKTQIAQGKVFTVSFAFAIAIDINAKEGKSCVS